MTSPRSIALALILSLLFFSNGSFANAFTVSPLGYTLTIDPGKSQTASISVSNNELSRHIYNVSVQSLRITEDGRRIYQKNFDPAELWVSVSPKTFSLNPGEKKNINFKISVPSEQYPGSRSLVLLVASESSGGQNIGLTAKTAIPIFLVVSGVVHENIIIQHFQPLKSLVINRNIPVAIEIYNNGTINTEVNGELTVTNSQNKRISGEKLRFGTGVFPDSVRRLASEITLPNTAWPGNYRVKLAIQYGASKNIISAEATIWYLPTSFMVIIFCSLAAILCIILWRRKK